MRFLDDEFRLLVNLRSRSIAARWQARGNVGAMHDQIHRAAMTAGVRLPDRLVASFDELGFVIVPSHLDTLALSAARRSCDEAVERADPRDVGASKSGTNTRVHLIEHQAELEALWLDPLLLALAAHAIYRPFKLGSLLSRTVHPSAAAQDLHVDSTHDDGGTTLVGFVWMIDAFRVDNGATQLVPGSHRTGAPPTPPLPGLHRAGAAPTQPALAVAPAGSLLVYDGAIHHGFTANRSEDSRRSIQGAFVLRTMAHWPDPHERARQPARTELARYLLG